MKSEIIKRDNYTINFIKSNKFKTCQIEVLFKQKLDVNKITVNSLLLDFLHYSTYKYPTKRELLNEFEYLYDSYVSGKLFKIGENMYHRYDLEFLNPKYCDDNFLKEVVEMLAGLIFNPNFDNGDYTKKAFDICKQNYRDYLTSLKEKPAVYAFKQALKVFGEGTTTGKLMDGTLEELDVITIDDLKETYKEMLDNTECYIYVVGNLNKDVVVSLIDKYFSCIKKNENNNSISVINKKREKILDLKEEGAFKQDTLLVFYNLDLETKKERNIDSIVFNFIFGAGGLTSKLYDRLREKNSLCYTISSIYNRYDNYIYIYAGINKKDKDLCLKLIDQCMEEMVKGEFSEEDIQDSIKALKVRYKNIESNAVSILDYRFNVDFCDNYELDEKIKLIEKVTKEDIISVAKKVKKNMTFLLCGDDENERA